MSFEILVQPINIEVASPSDTDIEAGANALMINMTLGIILPFQAGPGQPPIVAPLGIIKFPIGREQAEDLAEALAKESQKLPKQSALITANSLEGVDKVADFASKLRQ